MRQLAHSGWPLAWVISMVASLGTAALFFTGSSSLWWAFASVQAVVAFGVCVWLRQLSLRFADAQLAAEQPLWRATGLAIHDIGTPLHVVRFCIQQLTENPAIAQTPKFVEQLTRSSDRTAEAFERLRQYVRAVRDEEGPSGLRSTLGHAVKVVQAKFPDHPGAKSIDVSGTDDEMITMGSGPLVRSLVVLLGQCLEQPGNVRVATKVGPDQLHIAISSDSKGNCASDFRTRPVRRWVKEWGGKLIRTRTQGSGFGYALHLEREGRG